MSLSALIQRRKQEVATATFATPATPEAESSKSSRSSSSNTAETNSEQVSFWWRVRFPDRDPVETYYPSGESREGVLRAYPGATDAQPFTPAHTPPDAPMQPFERQAITAWLDLIGETDPAARAHVLARCETSHEVREYTLTRARQ
ncbi:MAG: hypothetical protein LBV29_05515 [Azoarcus sp.]|jgi:hypothetical protein|nr:hypothetical protein [Azoarcus sp.]